jgi:hypothetical protein
VVAATGWTPDSVLALSYEAATELLYACRRRQARHALETAQTMAAVAFGTATSSREAQERLISACNTSLLTRPPLKTSNDRPTNPNLNTGTQ